MKKLLLAAAVMTGIAGAASAEDILIYTGGAPTGENSTYHEGFGQALADYLEPIAGKYGYNVKLVPTTGAGMNAEKVAQTTKTLAFGFGQGGLTYGPVDAGNASILRTDLPGECAMAYTGETRLQAWGDIVNKREMVTWIVPEKSGSEAFVKRLYAEDANFAGAAPKFKYVTGTDAIMTALKDPSNRGSVGLFYGYPNPTRGTVNAAAKADLDIFGVLSPDIAQNDAAYYLNRKAPYQMAWLGLGETKTTRAMCSKALLFANDISGITDTWAAADLADILEAVKDAPASAFVPNAGPLAKLMSEVEKMSEEFGVNDMVKDLEEQIQKAKG